jgi:hypothetical protein
MFVVKHRHHPSTLAEDGDGLLEEAPARIEMLILFVEGVGAVLADDDYAVDGQGIAAEGERFADGREERDTVLSGEVPTDVVLGDLVGVERGDVDAGRHSSRVQLVAFEQPGDDVVGVRPHAVLGDDGGDAFARSGHMLGSLSGARFYHGAYRGVCSSNLVSMDR